MFHPPFCFQLNRSPEPPGRRVGALWPWRFWPRPPTSAARSGLGVSGAARRPKWTSQAPRPGCQGKRGRDTSILLKWNCMPQTHRHTHIYIPTTYMYVYIYITFLYILCITHWSQLVVFFPLKSCHYIMSLILFHYVFICCVLLESFHTFILCIMYL